MLSGGGARAAYQVGCLRLLAREFPQVVPGILTGVSAGGINAAYLAARQEPFDEKVENLAAIWSNIRIDNVFRVDVRDLASRSLRWGGRLLSGGTHPLPPARSMVDTAPLRALFERLLETNSGEIAGIAKSLRAGWLRGIGLTAPLSPAVHLGARRIIAVSTRYARSREEADRPAITGYPPPAQVAGVLYNAIFLDQLDGDALQLQQINRLLARLPEARHDSLRHIDLLLLRPSLDLGRLANQYE